MKILAIGDITGKIGCDFLKNKLFKLKTEKNINLVIANGENSAENNGITPHSVDFLFKSGVDVITTGNHTFRRRQIYNMLNEEKNLIRPLNYPKRSTPGRGICKFYVDFYKVYIINLMGLAYLNNNLRCPFETIDEILEKITDSNIIILDFHAEATAEKKSLGFYLDGRISAMFGTHTHVQTADETILPKGTGYITDVGMTGPINSSLGVKFDLAIRKFKTKLPVKFEFANGKCKMDCVIFEINEKTGKTTNIERLSIL